MSLHVQDSSFGAKIWVSPPSLQPSGGYLGSRDNSYICNQMDGGAGLEVLLRSPG